jgi:hypothetical protein
MIFFATSPQKKAELAEMILNSKGEISVEIDEVGTISAQQFKALHVYCGLLAKAFNDAGLSMQLVLKETAELSWTKDSVKHELWRRIQKALRKKTSTKKLNRVEPSDIYEHVNRFTAEKFGISIPWPSKDEQPGGNW